MGAALTQFCAQRVAQQGKDRARRTPSAAHYLAMLTQPFKNQFEQDDKALEKAEARQEEFMTALEDLAEAEESLAALKASQGESTSSNRYQRIRTLDDGEASPRSLSSLRVSLRDVKFGARALEHSLVNVKDLLGLDQQVAVAWLRRPPTSLVAVMRRRRPL